MTRSERLLNLLQLLRNHRLPVTADTLAETLSVSVRTVYRDIETLCRQGADIRGEAGVGFILHKDFLLPPLSFNANEIEALVLGMRWVLAYTDNALAQDAKSVLAKVQAVLPENMADLLDSQALFPVRDHTEYGEHEQHVLNTIRAAIRSNRKLEFDYTDAKNRPSRRTVWPFSIGYFDDARLVSAWCELRQDFRHFRSDRIGKAVIGDIYPTPRMLLLDEWRRREGIDLHPFDF
ncbi:MULTISPECIES: YafY family protein [unclassified Neisseria]|uniref:helix-turn-helix transcriptional regulator n=1 Tax=unclassified Neisseria TaxID=2623750 RepID=UPI002664ED17|nr:MULTISPECIES: YafY family protein [unclassified Neisseria]MDO1510258.1 YafY family protein [Neisseria sp. MVDL19-042950]MDO1516427.1 YafY family protein [Neisseria sp. MVDL18-041461]MDO1563575.1 YafY family protein [Neisseria sp. MVDL20-010259]